MKEINVLSFDKEAQDLLVALMWAAEQINEDYFPCTCTDLRQWISHVQMELLDLKVMAQTELFVSHPGTMITSMDHIVVEFVSKQMDIEDHIIAMQVAQKHGRLDDRGVRDLERLKELNEKLVPFCYVQHSFQ